MRKLTFNRDRCLACRSCELACAVAHSRSGVLLEAIVEERLPRRRVSMANGPDGLAALRCAQCDEPLCVYSCKSGALYQPAGGGVEFDESRCVGCLMCYMVCPVGIRRADHAVVRCDVCADRETPACVEACPTNAMGVEADVSRAKARNLREDAAPFTGHLVVVGSSAAGIAACEAAREVAPGCRITMVSADAEQYSRPLLPYVLAGGVDRERLAWRTNEHLASLGVEVLDRARAVGLSAEDKTLAIAPASPGLKPGTYDGCGSGTDGRTEIAFDRLIIATGARAMKLDVPGSDLPGVFQLRELEDLDGIEQTLSGRRPNVDVRAVVVGGGNVGLQAAEALARRGVRVTVVVKSSHVLSQMVDEEAGRRTGELFTRHGVTVRTGRDVVEIAVRPSTSSGRTETEPPSMSVRAEHVEARTSIGRVRLDNGEWIDADLVVVGKGIQPNVQWLRSSGVDVGRGVVVDRQGRTNVPDVFAAGDCAEMADLATGRASVSGIWPIAYEMGRVAGTVAVGGEAMSAGLLRMNSSRFFDTPIISIGEVRNARTSGVTEHVVAAHDGVYRKLVMKDGRLVGALLYGDVSDAGLYYRLCRYGMALEDVSAEEIERTRVHWIAAVAEGDALSREPRLPSANRAVGLEP